MYGWVPNPDVVEKSGMVQKQPVLGNTSTANPPLQIGRGNGFFVRRRSLRRGRANAGTARSRAVPANADVACTADRSGFAQLTAEVALGHVGIVLGLEVSRLARNNGDWYRLLDLCGMTDTLIGDADGPLCQDRCRLLQGDFVSL